MSTLPTDLVAFDTNVFIFGIRTPKRPSCEAVLFEVVPHLCIQVPNQVRDELQRNLNNREFQIVRAVLQEAKELIWDYDSPLLERIQFWESRGAKKGDAVIAASLEIANVKFLISENRHFLAEISDLPFQVLSAQQVLDFFDSP